MATDPGYPEPHPDRGAFRTGGGGGPGTALAVSPPITRILAFNLSGNPGVRTTVSSTRIRGPAIIQSLDLGASVSSLNSFALELGKSASSVTEQDVALTVPRPYTLLTERLSQTAAGENAQRKGFVQTSLALTTPRHLGLLNIIVLETEFFITISMVSLVAAGTAFFGHLVVLEAVPPETIAAFH